MNIVRMVGSEEEGGDGDGGRPSFSPPDHEVPGIAPGGGVLTRSADAALVLCGVRVYTTGLVLDVGARLRVEPDPTRDVFRDVHHEVLIGVELADGRTTTTLEAEHHWQRPPDVLTLRPLGGRGGGRAYDLTSWLSPAPPPGDVVVVAAWPALGLGEGRLVVPGDALAAARSDVVTLWQPAPARVRTPEEAPRPQVEPGGWFERALARPREDGAAASPRGGP
ncbi:MULTISPECIES: hypothetical protein [unclassified Actinotalea]|uniref:hypothetical protein n=1 Tax=unclassified Actinotalea TaxID=2638618 RepID=UPI0015F3617A|nr:MULTISPECIES: hypothetical protein [unclassified Actinotalea]